MSSKLIPLRTYFDAEERIWRGPYRKLETSSDASLGRSILEILLKNPNHIAQICENNGRQYTNKDIALLSIRVAQHLEEMGLQQEDVIGICGANTDYVAPLVFGALLCGTPVSTLDPSFDKDGIRHIFAITKPKIMFCDGKVYDTVQAALSDVNLDIPIFTMKDHREGARKVQELITPTGREEFFNAKPLRLGLEQTAAILCSSGTTGLPKGVCVSHGSMLNSIAFNLSPDDKLLCYSTLYWASGVLCLFQGTLGGCTRVIIDQAFQPEVFLRMIEQYRISIVVSAPSQMTLAIQSPDIKFRDISSLQLYACGGGALPFAVNQAFSELARDCKIIIGYGMSEIAGGCCFGLPTKPGACGQLLPNLEVKIIDETGKHSGIGERGEVLIKPPFRWAGYYGNKEATRAIYDQDEWIHSGDIGYFDEVGCLVIVDRKKDILKYNNFHFFPTEIEEVIIQMSDVVEVCVCGVPDIVSSFLPAAAVVKLPNSKLTEADVTEYVAEKMAHFKQLRGGVYFLDSLPKTASGKNIRAKVKEIVIDRFMQTKKNTRPPKGKGEIQVPSL